MSTDLKSNEGEKKLPDLESQNLQSLILTLTWRDVSPGSTDELTSDIVVMCEFKRLLIKEGAWHEELWKL